VIRRTLEFPLGSNCDERRRRLFNGNHLLRLLRLYFPFLKTEYASACRTGEMKAVYENTLAGLRPSIL
jgi:hypothetical protein